MKRYTAVLLTIILTGAALTACKQPAGKEANANFPHTFEVYDETDPPQASDTEDSQILETVLPSEEPDIEPSEAVTEEPSPVIEEEESPSPAIPDEPSEPEFSYADLSGMVFFFSSGAGGWWTEVIIQPDGTFTGEYSDWDMGDTGDGYPNGTNYLCFFSGRFSALEKISEFEYSMRCEELTQEGTPGEEKIVEGDARYITSVPYGFDDAEDFSLYLPGREISDLPESFLWWTHVYFDDEDTEKTGTLDFYGLYNIRGEQGFSSY